MEPETIVMEQFQSSLYKTTSFENERQIIKNVGIINHPALDSGADQ